MDSLTLYDYSDRELLFVVSECQDADTGYAKTKDIANAIGLDGDHVNSSVGSRMAWLRRWGAVDKQPKRSAWTVTAIGEELISGELNDRQRHLVNDSTPDSLLMLTRAVAGRYRRAGETAGHLMRREWKRGTQ